MLFWYYPLKKIILEIFFFNVVFLMGNIHCCWTMLLMFLKLTLRVFVKNKMENLKYFSSEQAKDMLILHFCFPWPVFFWLFALEEIILEVIYWSLCWFKWFVLLNFSGLADLRTAPFIENLVTIFRGLEATYCSNLFQPVSSGTV